MNRIIYIPGLGQERNDLSVKAYALRMMKAIDEQNPNPAHTYKIESSDREYDGEGSISDVVSIFEINGEEETEIYRLYEFKYGKFLTGKFQESNILYRFTTLLMVLVTRLFSVIKSIFSFKDNINKKSKIQALYFTVIYVVLALYLVLLIPSILGLLISFLSDYQESQQNTYINALKDYQEWFTGIIASFSAFMLLSPNSKNIFSAMATEYFSANQYLSIGDRRLLIMGKLNRLIEAISEEDDTVKIEIHGYSFGSILALDVIFPYEYEPNRRVKENINKLITIGCPFDFIEIYWTNYFSDRKYTSLSLTTWQNINSDLDVLSTKFDASPIKQEKFISSIEFWNNIGQIDITFNMVNPAQVSFTKMIMFYGLKAHQMYWDEHLEARSCLISIVKT
ncbi:MAG: hypothetical protein AB2551_14955 [Candidatus Thiodiazotropha sp.]